MVPRCMTSHWSPCQRPRLDNALRQLTRALSCVDRSKTVQAGETQEPGPLASSIMLCPCFGGTLRDYNLIQNLYQGECRNLKGVRFSLVEPRNWKVLFPIVNDDVRITTHDLPIKAPVREPVPYLKEQLLADERAGGG